MSRRHKRVIGQVRQVAQVEHIRIIVELVQLFLGIALRKDFSRPGREKKPVGLFTGQFLGIGNRPVFGQRHQLVAASQGGQLVKDILYRTMAAVHRVVILADHVHIFIAGIPFGQVRFRAG